MPLHEFRNSDVNSPTLENVDRIRAPVSKSAVIRETAFLDLPHIACTIDAEGEIR
jgi:hypothetical protein